MSKEIKKVPGQARLNERAGPPERIHSGRGLEMHNEIY